MTTRFLLILFLSVNTFVNAQLKEFTIIDSKTENPIEGVHLFYEKAEEGGYTNAEGIVRLMPRNEPLQISHLNYKQRTVRSEELTLLSRITLEKNTLTLDEVYIDSFDLKSAMQYVLDNYNDLYANYATEKECSFKEMLIVDGKIHRLILSELKWWSKSAALKGKRLEKETKLKLGRISHNKNVPIAFDKDDNGKLNPEASGHIVTKSLVANLFLNIAITDFLNTTGMLEVHIEKSTEDYTIVTYTTDWKNINNKANRTYGKIVFDKKTKAILEFQKNIEFRNNIKKTVSSFSNKAYQSDNKKQSLSYYFTRRAHGKFGLSRFSIDADVVLNFEDEVYNAKFKNDLYVVKEMKKNKVANDGLVDLEQAIYKAFPSKTYNSNAVVLTKEEKAFLETYE